MKGLKDIKGFTLIELIVSMVIFLFVIALMYPTFSLIRGQSTFIENMESLNERAQRLVDYMAEDIRMAGFVVGPKENIPYCTGNNSGVPVIQHTDGNPYDTLTFITSEPVTISLTQTCQNNNPGYWLNTTADAAPGTNQLTIENVPRECISNLDNATAAGNNGNALIALETASYVNNIYTVNQINTGSLILSSSLQITVPNGSMIYTVRQYQYLVDNARQLLRRSWNNNCSAQSLVLDEATGSTGGLDALQFEFLVYDAATDSIIVQATPPDDLLSLRGVRIWALVRSDSSDRDYTDTNTYNVGTLVNGTPITGISVGPFNDNFYRVLVNRTVEVKNFGG